MKTRKDYLWACLPALLLAAGAALAGPQPIIDCGTIITEPGKYKLMNDLSCGPDIQGVEVYASDVTIDLGGHTITCGAAVTGPVGAVLVFNASNVWITKGSISGCNDGVLLWETQGAKVTKMSFSGNIEAGITLYPATEGSVIMHNQFEGDFGAIRSWFGVGNRFSHNTMHNTYAGLDLYAESDSTITCNNSELSWYGLSIGPSWGVPSTGNIVRGNRVVDNVFTGILLYGVGTPDGATHPQANDNLVQGNIALGSWFADLGEMLYDESTGDLFLEDGATCQNTWKNNQFDWQLGPPDCIGTPVDLDDICGLHDDDD